MKKSQDFNQDKITLHEIKVILRSMPELEAPVTLHEKLLNAIPQKKVTKISVHPLRPRLGIWEFSASAAIIMITSLIFILNFSLSSRLHEPVADLNGVLNNYPNDLNDSLIGDSNYVSYIIQGSNIQKTNAIFQN